MVTEDDFRVYKMRPGEYIEDVDLDEKVEEYIEGHDAIQEYEVRVFETEGSRKNKLFFDVNILDPEELLDLDPTEAMNTIRDINEFLTEVTKRDTELRREDLKGDVEH